jgi:hypothetical protein
VAAHGGKRRNPNPNPIQPAPIPPPLNHQENGTFRYSRYVVPPWTFTFGRPKTEDVPSVNLPSRLRASIRSARVRTFRFLLSFERDTRLLCRLIGNLGRGARAHRNSRARHASPPGATAAPALRSRGRARSIGDLETALTEWHYNPGRFGAPPHAPKKTPLPHPTATV